LYVKYFSKHLCNSINVALFFYLHGNTNKYKFLFIILNFIIMAGSKVLLGVLAGAAAGAILGVLFAPDKGVETRRRVSEGSRDVAGNLKDRFSDLVDGIADRYESARDGATDLLEKGRQKVSGMTGSGSGSTSGSGTGTAGTSGLGAGAGAAASNMGAGSSYQS
jgi:gas vesicle protein